MVTGFYARNRKNRDGLWIAVSAWSLTCSVWILVSAALLWPDTPAELLGPLLSARHVLIGLGTACLLATLFVLTGRVPVVLTVITLALYVLRAVLWFTTDLIWTHEFTPAGQAIYGPLRNPFTLVLVVPVLAIVMWEVTRRPWQSELARRAVVFAITPGVGCGSCPRRSRASPASTP